MKSGILIAFFSLLSVLLIVLTPIPIDEIITALVAGFIALYEALK